MTRRMGLEQEFFVVEPGGEPSHRADELLQRCLEMAEPRGLSRSFFATEWVKNIVELNTPPSSSPRELADSYRDILQLAIDAGHEIGVRLYPYSVYPLHLIPVIRDEVKYHVQVRTIGHERFLNAGKCAGTHLHIEVPHGTIDSRVGIAYDAPADARAELLNTYNLATALDPVMIALSRACPFYEGRSSGLAHRTARYRGNEEYGWEGVYTLLPEVGSLRPYAESIEHLVQLQFARHHAWLNALSAARVNGELFEEAGGSLLTSAWNPVRLNLHGTVELRNVDSNLPEIVLGVMMLVYQLTHRVREERLIVTPTEGLDSMRVEGDRLLVPDFEHLHHQLLFAAVSEGLSSPIVKGYTQSTIEVACAHEPDWPGLSELVPQPGQFRTTESVLLEKYYPQGESLSREIGLELVREGCDVLEDSVRRLQESGTTEPLSTS
ncbi:glutamate-cysteine ligase family protein [Rubinisphaera margarita]|uniref:glutamate-cysteine ligase family protein n=1 Tax=Rubinisphaera margarita TaxID=2909586 RepID=UPI001EE8D0E0|nr:glutamate-cysteine ligase family protein [Rubinisphaera margarita]MCG6157316.1 glutamate-cysteine ligase family protein [Rubinisphaera margarita]